MPQPFYMGLNMTGTVSAGAYTAGVVDFLIEAMDAWYAERERQAQQFGSDYERWTIPPHEVQLAAMSGASGGGITAALAASALTQAFSPVRRQRAADNPASNVLFKSWVEQIDISKLLGHADLDSNPGKVVSLLDSTPIQNIAREAFSTHVPLPRRRPWVRDGLKIILTLTNLRGVPYAIEPQNDAESARGLYFADRQEFAVVWQQSGQPGVALPLYPNGDGAWHELSTAAMATSAFPVVLAAQKINRTAGEFNHRRWRIPVAEPKCDGSGICECETSEEMRPAWALPDEAQFETLNVDGGTTNNSPVDCCRLELAGMEPAVPSGHNPRDPNKADRAVINVAPLATELPGTLPPPASDSLLSLPGQILGVLLTQSRMQGENLRLTADPNVASRWSISPTVDAHGIEPLAGAALNAFGGFVSQVFREHDYQLGRRNCQRFLTNHFGLPWTNDLLAQYGAGQGSRGRWDAEYGFRSEADAAVRNCPVIPVMPDLRTEVKVERMAVDRSSLEPLCELAGDRVKRVVEALLAESGHGWAAKLAFDALWAALGGTVKQKLLVTAAGELARQGFVV